LAQLWLAAFVGFGQDHHGFVNIANFDPAQCGEERSDEGDFIIGEYDHWFYLDPIFRVMYFESF